jgi:hypothetical protein
MEEEMNIDPRRVQIIKLHKRWADGLTLIWLLIIIPLFAASYLLFSQTDFPTDERNGAFILLGVIIVVAAIWQAAGLAIARLHMIFDRINLEPTAQSK